MQRVLMFSCGRNGNRNDCQTGGAILHYAKRLQEVNRSFNLTGITGLREIFIKHFLTAWPYCLQCPYRRAP